MASASHEFWTTADAEKHELARTFEEGIERTHPDFTTSNRLCKFSYHCIWAPTSVTYYEYRGEHVWR